MGLICDCFYRFSHHQTQIEKLENLILEYEELMEQRLVNNSCCHTSSYDTHKHNSIYRDR